MGTIIDKIAFVQGSMHDLLFKELWARQVKDDSNESCGY
jgi:hypothetical protein